MTIMLAHVILIYWDKSLRFDTLDFDNLDFERSCLRLSAVQSDGMHLLFEHYTRRVLYGLMGNAIPMSCSITFKMESGFIAILIISLCVLDTELLQNHTV